MALGKVSKLRARLAGGGVDIKSAVVSGATAGTAIAVAGLKVSAQIFAVIRISGGVPSDVGSEVSISSAGNIKLSTTNTTGDKLVVLYAQPA